MMGGNQKTRHGLGEIQSIVSIHAIYAQKNQKEFKPDLVAKVRGSISLFCHKKRLLSAMITDNSLDNLGMVGFAITLPTLPLTTLTHATLA